MGAPLNIFVNIKDFFFFERKNISIFLVFYVSKTIREKKIPNQLQIMGVRTQFVMIPN